MTRTRAGVVAAAVTVFAVLALVGTAAAAPTKLKPFGTGQVSIAGSEATIVIDTGEFGGVSPTGNAQNGELLGDVVFSFTSRGDVGGGAPRFSLPINDGSFDPNSDYAFLDALNCGAIVGDNPGGTATLVSTQNPACKVNFHGMDYANWTTFASSNPTFRIARATPFIIADAVPPLQTSATYVATDIHFR
jgi:hypothetical protein